MKVKAFMAAMQKWVASQPGRENAEILLQIDGDTCREFGIAREGVNSTDHYLILDAAPSGLQINMREIRLN